MPLDAKSYDTEFLKIFEILSFFMWKKFVVKTFGIVVVSDILYPSTFAYNNDFLHMYMLKSCTLHYVRKRPVYADRIANLIFVYALIMHGARKIFTARIYETAFGDLDEPALVILLVCRLIIQIACASYNKFTC